MIQKTISTYIATFEDEGYNFIKYSSLNQSKKEELTNEAVNCGDDCRKAEIFCGIPAVEEAIKEYLEKYAAAIKVKAAHDSFMRKVNELDMINSFEQELASSEKLFKKVKAEVAEKKKKIDSDQKLAEYKETIPSWDLINEMISDSGFKEAGSPEVKKAIESIGMKADAKTILGLYSNTYENDNLEYGTEVLFTTKSYTVIDVNRGKRTVSCSFDYSDIADVREQTKKYEKRFRGKYGPTYYTVVYVSLNDGREIDFHEPISGTAEYIKQMADFENVLM